jgi:hypothetical protein
VLHLPEGAGPFPASVVCHPHPLYGGDMDNNVVLTVCGALVARSWGALRFNFRGTGRSEGQFGGGSGEREDVKAALDYLQTRAEVDGGSLGVVGYSFGGAVAFAAVQADSRVNRLALISPALSADGWSQLKGFARPRLVLLGDGDDVVPYQTLKRYIQDGPQFHLVEGADHSWWGFEDEISRHVGDFFGNAV